MNVVYYIILAMKEMKQDYFNRYDENIEQLKNNQDVIFNRLNTRTTSDNEVQQIHTRIYDLQNQLGDEIELLRNNDILLNDKLDKANDKIKQLENQVTTLNSLLLSHANIIDQIKLKIGM